MKNYLYKIQVIASSCQLTFAVPYTKLCIEEIKIIETETHTDLCKQNKLVVLVSFTAKINKSEPLQ
jgi:hypothetical protein